MSPWPLLLNSWRKLLWVTGSFFFASTCSSCWICPQAWHTWSTRRSMLVHRAARNAALLPVTGMDDLPGTLAPRAALAVEEACWSRLFMLRLQRTDSLSLSAVARTSCITRGCSSCRWKSTCRATPTWLLF
uniref:Uncharacterized protein n=1 Tax=Ixodes ricinus TaxID=34613 RepID=A0A6B0URR1_IXORI